MASRRSVPNPSREPSFLGAKRAPPWHQKKTKHMLIVSPGVHSMSCSLKVSLVAPNSQLAFSRLSVRLHLAFEDMWIPMDWQKGSVFLRGNMPAIRALICQPYSFSRSKSQCGYYASAGIIYLLYKIKPVVCLHETFIFLDLVFYIF